jgi:sialidase-1
MILFPLEFPWGADPRRAGVWEMNAYGLDGTATNRVGRMLLVLLVGLAVSVHAQTGPIMRTTPVFSEPGVYCAWPSVVRAANGDILVAFTATEEHLGPDGRILLVRSTDNAVSWGAPDTLLDTPIDDRESGFTQGPNGTLTAHLWSTFHTPRSYDALPPGSYPQDILDRWSSRVASTGYKEHGAIQGAWERRSSDNGHTWSRPSRGRDAVHGGIQLSNGTMLIASYRVDQPLIGVHVRRPDDTGYVRIAVVRSPQPDSIVFGEPHIAQLRSGRVIMMIRATARPYNDLDSRCHLWETYSDDDGKTWAEPFQTPLWGYPPHLLVLEDGRVLCTYGYRRPPFGERACVSRDGVTWMLAGETVLSADGPNGDLGYPASIALGGGRILTVYYQAPVPPGTVQQMHPPDPLRVKPSIIGTVWEVPQPGPRR